MAQMYGAGVTIPASGDGIQLPDGSIVTGKALDAYNQAYSQNLDVGGAKDAALGSMLADKVTDLRQQIQAGLISDDNGDLTKQLNVATAALESKDAYYVHGIAELLPAGVTRLSGDGLAPLNLTDAMLHPDDNSSFGASAYFDTNQPGATGTGVYSVAFRGTTNLTDALNDYQQATGQFSQQYQDAANIAQKIIDSQAA
eukprot:gene41666-51569_t